MCVMKIICLVKIVPNVSKMNYDYENHVINRDTSSGIVNPDDVLALSKALALKEEHGVEITVISMGTLSVLKKLEDFIKIGVDQCILISDKVFAGSDSLATSNILSKYINEHMEYDFVFSGTHSLDGDTAHVPFQVAEALGIECINYVKDVNCINEETNKLIFEVEKMEEIHWYEVTKPILLAMKNYNQCKLPFVKYDDLKKDVSDQIHIVTNGELGMDISAVGTKGSTTKVINTYYNIQEEAPQVFVKVDDVGIEVVYQFLQEKGLL